MACRRAWIVLVSAVTFLLLNPCHSFFANTDAHHRRPFAHASMATSASHLPAKRKLSGSAADVQDVSEQQSIAERAEAMASRAKDGLPLVDSELEEVLTSIKNIQPDDDDSEQKIDYDVLSKFLSEVAHLSHKDWERTGNNAQRLGELLMPNGMTPEAHRMLQRICTEGNWDAAAEHGRSLPESDQPWAVLVTGVNGIRKTTSIYQPWFPDLLAEALVPPEEDAGKKKDGFKKNQLPVGSNSFFRQLDHMVATLCNVDFEQLYRLVGSEFDVSKGEEPSKVTVQRYSDLKASIFTRYRTLSELLGAQLLREAQKVKSNCMMETSGRDVAMFHYVDHFFPSGYHKLALHFTINDLSQAQSSVDKRMVKEIKAGIQAVEKMCTKSVIIANAGGPYGSEVLPGVQEDSDRVWNDVVMKGEEVGRDWYRANFAIEAHPTEPWTVRAVKPDGSLGTVFTFENKV